MTYINIFKKGHPFLFRTVLLIYSSLYSKFHTSSIQFSTDKSDISIDASKTAFDTDEGTLRPPVTNWRHLKIDVLMRQAFTS